MIDYKVRRRLKRRMSAEKPSVWIGKDGITPRIVTETIRHLDKKEIVKVKVLKTALKHSEAKAMATQIAIKTESSLVDIRGHTFLLYKTQKRKV